MNESECGIKVNNWGAYDAIVDGDDLVQFQLREGYAGEHWGQFPVQLGAWVWDAKQRQFVQQPSRCGICRGDACEHIDMARIIQQMGRQIEPPGPSGHSPEEVSDDL